MMIDRALDILVPSWWEIKVTVAASVFVVFAYWFFTYRSGDAVDRALVDSSPTNSGDTERDKVNYNVLSFTSMVLMIKYK